MKQFVVIGTAGDKRVELFQQALHRLGWPPAALLTYQQLLTGRVHLAELVKPHTIVRIESPGKGWEPEQLLLQAGAEACQKEGLFASHPAAEIAQLLFDKGRLQLSRQWFWGLCHALDLIEQQLQTCPPHQLLNSPAAIRLMFDKQATQRHLPPSAVPPFLPPLSTYDELITEMKKANMWRVFIKLRHGSSAAGAVAFETNGRAVKATSTVEMVQQKGELKLYNSRQIQIYRDEMQIAQLIDALGRQAIHVEQWIPKLSWQEQVCDVRLLVINGRGHQALARLSHTPMTNLHLLNNRAHIEPFIEYIGPAAWHTGQTLAEQAVQTVSGAFYAGVDVLFTPHKKPFILELNAFGDLLPQVFFHGQDSYTSEILASIS